MAEDFSDSITIVYPADWPKRDQAHSTIIFLGNISEADFTKEDVQSVIEPFRNNFLVAQTAGIEYFGENNDVTVVRVEHDLLESNRLEIESGLNQLGIYNASQFGYNPHVTIEPEDVDSIPDKIVLSPPVVWWGDDA